VLLRIMGSPRDAGWHRKIRRLSLANVSLYHSRLRIYNADLLAFPTDCVVSIRKGE
jgi:hypothetical protein